MISVVSLPPELRFNEHPEWTNDSASLQANIKYPFSFSLFFFLFFLTQEWGEIDSLHVQNKETIKKIF